MKPCSKVWVIKMNRQEVLSLQDALRCSTHLSIRWRHLKILCPKRDFLQTHLQELEFFFGSQVTRFWRDSSRHFETPMRNLYQEVYKRMWYRKGLLIALLEESCKEYLQISLQADSALMRRHEQNTSGILKIKMTARKGHWAISPDSCASHPMHF